MVAVAGCHQEYDAIRRAEGQSPLQLEIRRPHRVQTTLHLIEVSSPPHAGHGFGLASFTGRA